jgi:hypothetical protein
MKRASALLLGLLLLPAASAEAKFSAARVCGPLDCRDVTLVADRKLLAMEKVAFSAESRLGARPPQASPWYRVTLCPGSCDARGALAFKVLPSAGYAYLPPSGWDHVTGDTYPPRNGWAKIGEDGTDAFRGVTRDLGSFPASRLVALGATDPSPGPDESGSTGTSGDEAIPAWGWIAIASAIAAGALAVLVMRRRVAG